MLFKNKKMNSQFVVLGIGVVVLACMGMMARVALMGGLGKPSAADGENQAASTRKELVLKPVEEAASEVAPLNLPPASMTVSAYSSKDEVITVKIINQSGYTITFGNEYSLQQKKDGEWVDMVPETELAWTLLGHELEDMKVIDVQYDLSFYGNLEPGDYKLCKTDMEAEFTLMEKP